MPHQVRIEPSGRTFTAVGEDSLLEAALRAGLTIDYGCSNGHCGRCRARLLNGQVRQVRPSDYPLGEAERIRGAILTCAVAPTSDVVIESGEATSVDQLGEQSLVARLQRVELLGDGVGVATLRTPRSQRFRFLAGQRARLEFEGLPPIELGIASCPCEEGLLRFDLHGSSDTGLPRALLDGTVPRFAPIAVSGPYGRFVLDGNATRPLLLVAIGSGFAAIRSLVEHALALEQSPSITLWRLALPGEALYLDNHGRAWADALDDFHYVNATLDATSPEAAAEAARRLVADHRGEGEVDAYAAGPVELVGPFSAALVADRPRWTVHSESAGCPA